MKIETHGWLLDKSHPIPPRTFVELSDEEVLEALRRYVAEESGVAIPLAKPSLSSLDGAPRNAGFMFVLQGEAHADTAPLFEET